MSRLAVQAPVPKSVRALNFDKVAAAHIFNCFFHNVVCFGVPFAKIWLAGVSIEGIRDRCNGLCRVKDSVPSSDRLHAVDAKWLFVRRNVELGIWGHNFIRPIKHKRVLCIDFHFWLGSLS